MSFSPRFIKNCCRICKQTFCCVKCRKKHENKVHNIHPDCNICLYGKTFASNINNSIFEHIKVSHLPLHCVSCKESFVKIMDAKESMECPQRPKNIMEILDAKTPRRGAFKDLNQASNNPLVLKYQKIAVTSTPINVVDCGLVSCSITPVELNTDKKSKLEANNNLDSDTPPTTNDVKKNSKRRVTFGETPEQNVSKKIKDCTESKPNTEKKLVKTEEFPISPIKIEPEEKFSDTFEEYEKFDEIKVQRSHSISVNDTLWKSAINLTVHCNSANQEIIVEKEKIVFTSKNSKDQPTTSNNFDDISKCVDETSLIDNSSISTANESKGLWQSVSFLIKNVVRGFSNVSSADQNERNVTKRHRSENDITLLETQKMKKLKLTDIKCRPPIRSNVLEYKPIICRPKKIDKATQTDDDLWKQPI